MRWDADGPSSEYLAYLRRSVWTRRLAVVGVAVALVAAGAWLLFGRGVSADQRIASMVTVKGSDLPGYATLDSSMTIQPEGCPVNLSGLDQTGSATTAFGSKAPSYMLFGGAWYEVESLATVWRSERQAHLAYQRIEDIAVWRCYAKAEERRLRADDPSQRWSGHERIWRAPYGAVGDESQLHKVLVPYARYPVRAQTLLFRAGRVVGLLWAADPDDPGGGDYFGPGNIDQATFLRLAQTMADRARAHLHGT